MELTIQTNALNSSGLILCIQTIQFPNLITCITTIDYCRSHFSLPETIAEAIFRYNERVIMSPKKIEPQKYQEQRQSSGFCSFVSIKSLLLYLDKKPSIFSHCGLYLCGCLISMELLCALSFSCKNQICYRDIYQPTRHDKAIQQNHRAKN